MLQKQKDVRLCVKKKSTVRVALQQKDCASGSGCFVNCGYRRALEITKGRENVR